MKKPHRAGRRRTSSPFAAQGFPWDRFFAPNVQKILRRRKDAFAWYAYAVCSAIPRNRDERTLQAKVSDAFFVLYYIDRVFICDLLKALSSEYDRTQYYLLHAECDINGIHFDNWDDQIAHYNKVFTDRPKIADPKTLINDPAYLAKAISAEKRKRERILREWEPAILRVSEAIARCGPEDTPNARRAMIYEIAGMDCS